MENAMTALQTFVVGLDDKNIGKRKADEMDEMDQTPSDDTEAPKKKKPNTSEETEAETVVCHPNILHAPLERIKDKLAGMEVYKNFLVGRGRNAKVETFVGLVTGRLKIRDPKRYEVQWDENGPYSYHTKAQVEAMLEEAVSRMQQ